MTEHTPAPWRYQREVTVKPGGKPQVTFEIYTATGKFGHPASCDLEADARLICAAPDLLEALKRVLQFEASFGENDIDDIDREYANAVIARAEGK